jgi:hypothetical protein
MSTDEYMIASPQVGDIYKNAVATEVSKGSALMMNNVSRMQPHASEAAKTNFQIQLRAHVEQKLYLKPPPPKPKKKKKKVHPIDMDGDGKVSTTELVAAAANSMGGTEITAGKSEPSQDTGLGLRDDYTSQVRDPPLTSSLLFPHPITAPLQLLPYVSPLPPLPSPALPST